MKVPQNKSRKAPQKKSRQTPQRKSPLNQLWDLPLRADRVLTLFLVISMAAFAPVNFAARASEQLGDDAGQASIADQSEPSSAASEDASGDYRLAPGDRLTIVVFDQPQLSGEFIIDGGGGILLPLAGGVSLKGLTLADAQKLIQDRFADGVLVQPAVSVRITEYRPIFVTGSVRKPGSYSFMLGESVKAAIATAGGEGQPLEQPMNVAASDFITAEQRVRQLEVDQATLLVRKARLEAQRDGRENFIMPLLVGLNRRSVEFDHAYSAENDTFSRLAETYRGQVEALQQQRPRVEAEINAVTAQIAKQKEHLDIVNSHLTDLELLFGKGLLRKEVLLNQQIERSLVEAQISNLEAQVAHLRQTMGELDVKLGDLKAAFVRQTLGELQDTSQRLREIETSIGPARKILEVKAVAASDDADDEPEYSILISRARDGRMVTFEATNETTLSPGDVVEVKLKRRAVENLPSLSTQAVQSFDPTSSVAEGSR
jgi:polysaccharide export outer membrane protein